MYLYIGITNNGEIVSVAILQALWNTITTPPCAKPLLKIPALVIQLMPMQLYLLLTQ